MRNREGAACHTGMEWRIMFLLIQSLNLAKLAKPTNATTNTSTPPQSIRLTTNISKSFLSYNEWLIHQLCSPIFVMYSINGWQANIFISVNIFLS